MKSSRTVLFACHLFAACGLLASASFAHALPVTIDMVTIGDPGNAADTLVMNDSTAGYGSVGYMYNIGTYLVTNSQYAAFLNAVAATDAHGLYSSFMGSNGRGGITRSGTNGSFTYAAKANFGNKPVNFVSFWDAARFTNWLHNGQPTGAQGPGTTETGAYNLSGITEPTNNTVLREAGALFYLPSEDEWYKAAYYDPTLNGGAGGYHLYATQSSTEPTVATANSTGDIVNAGANVANYSNGATWNGQFGNVTTVGSAGPLSASYYGTFDQSGNVEEWNEQIIDESFRGLRGGAFPNGFSTLLAASFRNFNFPTDGSSQIGFRVASPFFETAAVAVIPEPSMLPLASLLLASFVLRRSRKTRL